MGTVPRCHHCISFLVLHRLSALICTKRSNHSSGALGPAIRELWAAVLPETPSCPSFLFVSVGPLTPCFFACLPQWHTHEVTCHGFRAHEGSLGCTLQHLGRSWIVAVSAWIYHLDAAGSAVQHTAVTSRPSNPNDRCLAEDDRLSRAFWYRGGVLPSFLST